MRAEQSRAEQSRAIDVVKFLMAICVVAIHTEPMIGVVGWKKDLYDTVVALSVPFFFTSTGYLVFGSLLVPYECVFNQNKLKRQINKFLKTYLLWSFIYLPLAIYGFVVVEKCGIVKALVLYIRNILLQGQNYFSYPLWYLLAALYASMAFYFVVKKGFPKKDVFLAIIVSFIATKGTNFLIESQDSLQGTLKTAAFLLQKTIADGRVFSGIYAMLIGALIRKYKEKIDLIGKQYLILCFIVLFTTDVFFDNTFLRVAVCVSFFCWIQSLKFKFVKAECGLYLRRLSAVLFYTHMIFFFIFGMLVGKEPAYGLTGFIVSLVAAIVFGIFVNREKKINNGIIRFLFG
ncbi:acyltransferase family protein [Coprococcus comes]|uniref:Acyltransferase 3 domain-containing protein n=2 Tax=Coprococcus TaxID=33042 RepID=A0A414UCY7_9FIRM|nr:acyltransferase family protein [Coprococcus comes]RHG60876.1 hypothetical protein DW252_06845 [Coprococcus comes]